MYRSLFSNHSMLDTRPMRPRGPKPSSAQIHRAAADAISTLRDAGVTHACFVGGMACNLFGNLRQPEDIDVLCLTTNWEQEALKHKLVELNSNFYLIASRDPTATYQVLWYRLYDTDSCVKVDLLFPGVLDIPSIPSSSITRSNVHHLPCAPLSLVLLLKLQAWIHHGEAIEYRYRAKRPTDVRDIEALLLIASKMGLRLQSESALPQLFVSKAMDRVVRFVREVPSSRVLWENLGMIKKVNVAPGKVVLPAPKPKVVLPAPKFKEVSFRTARLGR